MKWIRIVLGGLIGLVVILAAVLSVIGYQKLGNTQSYQVTESFTVLTSSEAVARGEHLVNSTTGCLGCHGDGAKGQVFFEGLPFGTLAAPNLTLARGWDHDPLQMNTVASWARERLGWTDLARHGLRAE